MTTFLHLFEFAVIAVTARLVFVWCRPFRDDGKRRFGAGWPARVHQLLLQMIDEWRAR